MISKYDLVFSIGPTCRVAYYLQLSNLRTYAYPFDWLGTNLKIIISLFKSDFKLFLNNYQDISDEWHVPGFKNIKDNNGIIIAHHIKDDIEIEEAITNCKKLMTKRYRRLKEHLKLASNIAIVTNQNVNLEELKNFLKTFSDLFPNKKITLVNIKSNKKEKQRLEINLSHNLKIMEYYFNDVNKDGDIKDINPNFWLGNEAKWLEVMEELKKGK